MNFLFGQLGSLNSLVFMLGLYWTIQRSTSISHFGVRGYVQLCIEACNRLLIFVLQHPGMDFSGAEMGGSVPDASTFMGGFAKQ